MNIFPQDNQILEATYRLSTTREGGLHLKHLQDMLKELDVDSRRMSGEQALINNGKRQCLEELLKMFAGIKTAIEQRRDQQRMDNERPS